jgi:ferredoxin
VRIVIDRAACLQSGQCAYMQPELFGFQDDTGPVIRVERPTGKQLEQAREAVVACPSQAIRLEPEAGDA